MRTSATGNRRARVARDSSRRPGFTLVELMAVFAIIGLAAAVVMLTLPAATPDVGDEAARFGARLSAAREEAVMTNRTVAIDVTERGYAAQVLEAGGWKSLTDGPFQPELWRPGTILKGDAVRVAFDPTGLTEPVTIILVRKTETAAVTLTIDGAGEVRIQ